MNYPWPPPAPDVKDAFRRAHDNKTALTLRPAATLPDQPRHIFAPPGFSRSAIPLLNWSDSLPMAPEIQRAARIERTREALKQGSAIIRDAQPSHSR